MRNLKQQKRFLKALRLIIRKFVPTKISCYTVTVFFCAVFGFDILGASLEDPTFTAVESSTETYTLPIKMIKGLPLSRVDVTAEVLPGGTVSE